MVKFGVNYVNIVLTKQKKKKLDIEFLSDLGLKLIEFEYNVPNVVKNNPTHKSQSKC